MDSPVVSYKELISNYPSIVVLRLRGGFYNAFEDCAIALSSVTGYKVKKNTDDSMLKCGFPVNALDKVTKNLDDSGVGYVVFNGTEIVSYFPGNPEEYKKRVDGFDYSRIVVVNDTSSAPSGCDVNDMNQGGAVGHKVPFCQQESASVTLFRRSPVCSDTLFRRYEDDLDNIVSPVMSENIHKVLKFAEAEIEEMNFTEFHEVISSREGLEEHSYHVAYISVLLGMLFGFDLIRLIHLGTGGLLHDVGKCRITGSILDKPGELNFTERQLIQSHPSIGYKFVSQYGFDKDIYDMVLYHHERLDGSGYPLGLGRDHIPIEAQFCTIADIFDAIHSKRVYHDSCTVDQTLAKMALERGLNRNVFCILRDYFSDSSNGSVCSVYNKKVITSYE